MHVEHEVDKSHLTSKLLKRRVLAKTRLLPNRFDGVFDALSAPAASEAAPAEHVGWLTPHDIVLAVNCDAAEHWKLCKMGLSGQITAAFPVQSGISKQADFCCSSSS